MISIILPVYNRAKVLAETLNGIAQQTFSDYEVIIVNDGSTDEVDKVFGDYYRNLKTTNHYLFLNQKNQGAPAARNRGWQEAKGEYLLFCDGDAVLKPEALEKMFQALQDNPQASYAYPSFYWGKKLFKVGTFDPGKLKKMPYIHTMALIRRSDFPVGGWDINIKKFQDWDLWLTMLEEGKVGVFVPEVLFTVKTGGTMSSWLPGFAYQLFPFLPSVKKYKQAMKIIKEKHALS